MNSEGGTGALHTDMEGKGKRKRETPKNSPITKFFRVAVNVTSSNADGTIAGAKQEQGQGAKEAAPILSQGGFAFRCAHAGSSLLSGVPVCHKLSPLLDPGEGRLLPASLKSASDCHQSANVGGGYKEDGLSITGENGDPCSCNTMQGANHLMHTFCVHMHPPAGSLRGALESISRVGDSFAGVVEDRSHVSQTQWGTGLGSTSNQVSQQQQQQQQQKQQQEAGSTGRHLQQRALEEASSPELSDEQVSCSRASDERSLANCGLDF